MNKILLRSDKNEIAILTLNSPKNLNALSEAMLEALKLNLEEIEKSKKIKAVIINAAGRAFCPGHDLKEMQEKEIFENDGAKRTEKFIVKMYLCYEAYSGVATTCNSRGTRRSCGCGLSISSDM